MAHLWLAEQTLPQIA